MTIASNRITGYASFAVLVLLFGVAITKLFGTTVSRKFSSANMRVNTQVVFGPPTSAPREWRRPTPTPEPTPTPTVTREREPERVEPQLRAGQLTARAWRDLDDWTTWTELLTGGARTAVEFWGIGDDERYTVRARSQEGPARNVPVELLDRYGTKIWSARTNGDGDAELFSPRNATGPLRVRVSGAKPRPLEGHDVTVHVAVPRVQDAIEVMFVVDATASMADELTYVQSELTDVVNRVRAGTRHEIDLRVGAAVYRDRDDEYLVQMCDLHHEATRAQEFLLRQRAGGGGDFPEAVDEALEAVLRDQQWNTNARARLMFLVLDAPPHEDEAGRRRLQNAVKRAADLGVQIVPIVGSGIGKPTEFLMRSVAISTNGTYVFLTDDSGIGGAHVEASVGESDVERLNDLIVRLIVEAAS